MNVTYSKDVDIAYIKLETGKYEVSKEFSEGIVVDVAKNGKILGIEIYEASKRLPQLTKKLQDSDLSL